MSMAKRAQEDRCKSGWQRIASATVLLSICAAGAWAQSGSPASAPVSSAAIAASLSSMQSRLQSLEGRTVLRIEFDGVEATRLSPIPDQLAQQPRAPLKIDFVRQSLRRLYATGLYDTIEVEGIQESGPDGAGVVLTFRGKPRLFLGLVTVEGAKGANTNAMLVRISRLTPGTRFTAASLAQAETLMSRTLAEDGFHEPTFSHTFVPHPADQLIDIAYKVVSGPQARTGTVTVNGDSGISPEDFRHYSHLKSGHLVVRDTSGRALEGLVKHYRKEERLEAEVKLESQLYDPTSKRVNYSISAIQGPVVTVLVDGVKLGQGRIQKLVPVYEEGTVDEDLLNEGSRRLENYYQRLGYFDAKVEHEEKPPTAANVEIVYHVQLGARHRVGKVSITGAGYFDQATLKELLSVRSSDSFDRQGIYNQSLVAYDIGALKAIYQNNGFSKVAITPEIHDRDSKGLQPVRSRQIPLDVTYHIEEGLQQRVQSVEIKGAEQLDVKPLTALLNTAVGQPLSPESLAGDRETILTHYLSRGFDHARVELSQTEQPDDPSHVNVLFQIYEGEQVFLRRVLMTGLHFTRPDTVARAITLHEGAPLDETALIDTQRNLYNLALFSEVNPVIQNPTGQEPRKTVLLQTSEARRWDISYGFGFEAQTGTVNGSASHNPNGDTGVSPRGLLEVSRINLFGRDQTASLRGTLGFLEQRVSLLYQYPHVFGNQNFGLSVSGGYNNSQDVTTYSASKLEGSIRLTQHFLGEHSPLSKANTFIYQFIYRRVKVNAGSVELPFDEVSLDSQAVRVGGPEFIWIRDTRDAPLDAQRGTYTSFQEFLSSAIFASQANFNQVDVSNSSYYRIDHNRIVLARNTRYGQERAYGQAADELIPLPERLYGGGANSHRGFGVNSAGPRDPQTGFPIGGAGVFVNSTELRLPPPTLPWLGNTLSFVVFHDMGNVINNAHDIWTSAIRFRQQDRAGCRNLTYGPPTHPLTGPVTSTGQEGTCTFNYFSHALGLGLRYHTPVGPIRVDFSYNLNPPIYPVTYDAVNKINLATPYVGEGSHFNFFFSLGQSF